MTTASHDNRPPGWEGIWRLQEDAIHPRYRTLAEPDPRLVEWMQTVPAGAALLDVGCGVGRHSVYLGARGYHMAGVDISPTGIEKTQAACAERGIPFEGKVSDMTHIPWPDATFDGAFSIATIHHHRRADIMRAFDEVWRVLKPGGLFFFDFLCTEAATYERYKQQVAQGEVLEVEPNTFVDERPDSEDLDGYLPHHFEDEAGLRALLHRFEIDKLWADLREIEHEGRTLRTGKWAVWVRRPDTHAPTSLE
ncbi:MAG: hypothetical protein OHK0046_22120 [Anaerolineae bacterium]